MEQLKRQYIEEEENLNLENKDSSHEIDMTNIINNAHSLDELFDILENVKEINGSNQTLSSEELISQIEAVQHKQADLETITKTFGLRDKVLELLDGDVLSKELQERKIIEQVSSAKSIEELMDICNKVEFIDTSSGPMNGKDIASIIEKIEYKLLPLEALTRADGLRDKVYELLGNTVVSQELEERKEFEQVRNSLLENDEGVEENLLEKTKQEYELAQTRYQEAYEKYRNLIAMQPTGLKKLFSFFSNKKQMQELEEEVNVLKAEYQEKEAEYINVKEKIVPFHE
jgi:hypothetical protein